MQTLETSNPETISQKSTELYRYLGLLAIVRELPKTDEYLHRQVETELAESIDTHIGTNGKAEQMVVIDGCLTSFKNINMTKSAYKWAVMQRERANQDQRFEWLSDIAKQELQEYVDVAEFYETAQVGDTYVVVSPFPEEAYTDTNTRDLVGQAGYNPNLKRAFVRAFERSADGLAVQTQSIDASDITIWNHVMEPLGAAKSRSSLDILANRVYVEQKAAQEVIDEITKAYDDQLFLRTGKVHRFGREKGGSIEANTFIWQHPEIIEDTIRELQEIHELDPEQANAQADRVLYNSMALIKHLFNNVDAQATESFGFDSSVRGMRDTYGAKAAAKGEVFYNCSGSSTTVSTNVDSDTSVFASSFSMKNALEVHDCITCPMCKRTVRAVRDPKTATWACPKTDCAGYNEDIISRSNSSILESLFTDTNTQKDFGDLLIEFFFGGTKKSKRK